MIQLDAWVSRFKRWQLACKISDKAVENRILEAIPNQLADQICVGLVGNETKAQLLAKIKDTIVKKRSELMTDSGTADYAPDLMSSIFSLSDPYTKEKTFPAAA